MKTDMEKKLWNYVYSILLSTILLLLLGIFIHLNGNGNKIENSPADAVSQTAEISLETENDQDKREFFLYDILTKKEDEIRLFDQFMRKKERTELAKVAIIIDDLGYQLEIFNRIMNLNYPITISILPFLPYSKAVAEMARLRENITVLLHLPMEPEDSNINPGKGAIFSTMNEQQIRDKMTAVFRDLPYVDGVNNHMGSKVTQNREVMRILLSEINNRGIFFIDSMTSPNSVGYELSKKMGIKTAYRSVFLDNEQDIDYIQNQVNVLKELALKNGNAIAIGHPYCNTIEVLSHLDSLEVEGIKIVKLEELLE